MVTAGPSFHCAYRVALLMLMAAWAPSIGADGPRWQCAEADGSAVLQSRPCPKPAPPVDAAASSAAPASSGWLCRDAAGGMQWQAGPCPLPTPLAEASPPVAAPGVVRCRSADGVEFDAQGSCPMAPPPRSAEAQVAPLASSPATDAREPIGVASHVPPGPAAGGATRSAAVPRFDSNSDALRDAREHHTASAGAPADAGSSRQDAAEGAQTASARAAPSAPPPPGPLTTAGLAHDRPNPFSTLSEPGANAAASVAHDAGAERAMPTRDAAEGGIGRTTLVLAALLALVWGLRRLWRGAS